MSEEIKSCEFCAEDAVYVECSPKEHIVRVGRVTKCMSREAPCKTTVCENKQAAIDAWNFKQEERRGSE